MKTGNTLTKLGSGMFVYGGAYPHQVGIAGQRGMWIVAPFWCPQFKVTCYSKNDAVSTAERLLIAH